MALRIHRLSRFVTIGSTFAAVTFGLLVFAFSVSAQAPQEKAKEATSRVGLIVNDTKAFKGYTLFSPMNHKKTYLLDMDGKVVNMWNCDCEPGETAFILPNGNLLRAGRIDAKRLAFNPPPGHGGRIQEFTWDGKLVWDYKIYSDNFCQHHDICPMPNGNVLCAMWDRKSKSDVIAAGRVPGLAVELMPDSVFEIKKTGDKEGQIVWEWHVWDHLIQEHDKTKANYGVVKNHPELVDINYGSGVLQDLLVNKDSLDKLKQIGYVGGGKKGDLIPDWTHVNSIDYNAELDQIMISVHEFSEIWIIDHSTTTEEAKGHTGGKSGRGGDLLYRWGNPQAYQAVPSKNGQHFYGQHSAHWIRKGLPGAGNILVFNNGLGRMIGDKKVADKDLYSSIDEIVPPMSSDGKYKLETGKPFGPAEPKWVYTAEKKSDFYGMLISGVQRLPNGNTFICVGPSGKLFEVTPEKGVAWEYHSPVSKATPYTPPGRMPPKETGLTDKFGPKAKGPGGFGNAVFRVLRYAPDYEGFKGKDLKAGPPVEDLLPTVSFKK